MNLWLIAAAAVAISLIPCAVITLRGSPERRLVGLEMTGIVLTIMLVLLTIGSGRKAFIDLPLVLAVLSFGSGIVFVRFLEKHL